MNKRHQEILVIYDMLEENSFTTYQLAEYSKRKSTGFIKPYIIRGYLLDELKDYVLYDKYTYIYSKKKGVSRADLDVYLYKRFEEREKRHRLVQNNFRNGKSNSITLKNMFNYQNECVFEIAQNYLKKKYLNLKIQNNTLKNIVVAITKDNKITKIEQDFLSEKIKELGIGSDIILKIKDAVNENNHYLDDILHAIFEDRKITRNEVLFLYEKVFENEICKKAVIRRFWQIGLIYYPTTFAQLEGFTSFIKLEYLLSEVLESKYKFHYPKFFKIDNFDSIFIKPVRKMKAIIIDTMSRKNKSFNEKDLNEVLGKIKVNRIVDFRHQKMQKQHPDIHVIDLKIMLEEEKRRIGSPDAALFCENIKFRLGI